MHYTVIFQVHLESLQTQYGKLGGGGGGGGWRGGGAFVRQGQVDSGEIVLDLKTHQQGAQSGWSSDYL